MARALATSPIREVFSRRWGMSRVKVAGRATASLWGLRETWNMLVPLWWGEYDCWPGWCSCLLGLKILLWYPPRLSGGGFLSGVDSGRFSLRIGGSGLDRILRTRVDLVKYAGGFLRENLRRVIPRTRIGENGSIWANPGLGLIRGNPA